MLTTLAPHLVKPVPFLYPLTHRGWERPYVAAGLAALRHDGRRTIACPAQKHLTRAGALRLAPALQARRADRRGPLLRRRRPTTPGTRMTVARTAAPLRRGRADLDAGRRVPARGGPRRRRAGARRRGRAVEPTSAATSSSTAPACGPTRSRRCPAGAAGSGCARPRACTSSCRATAIIGEAGLILRTATSVLFVIPWGNHWIIGTTDTDWNLDLAHPGGDPRRHRLHPRRTSTRCWSRR